MRQGEDVPAHVQLAIVTRREMTKATYEDLQRWVKAEFQLEIRSPTTIHRILKRQANRRITAEELAQSLDEARVAMSPERLEVLDDVRNMQRETLKAIKDRFNSLVMKGKSKTAYVSEVKLLVSVLKDLVEVEKEIKPTKDPDEPERQPLEGKLDLTQMSEEELNELAAAEGYPGMDQVEKEIGIGGPECDPGGNREMPPERLLLDADVDENA